MFFEQILEAAPAKTVAVPPISEISQTRHAKHCWRNRGKLLSDILQWTPTHRYTNFGWPAKSYIYYLFVDTGCSLQDLLIIIIIIVSCRQHGYPWLSLATSPYRSSPLAGLQGYIPYPHIAAICMFVLVILLLLGHMWGSIGVHHLWARSCFSSSVLHVWFV